jgi:hypothetical protein
MKRNLVSGFTRVVSLQPSTCEGIHIPSVQQWVDFVHVFLKEHRAEVGSAVFHEVHTKLPHVLNHVQISPLVTTRACMVQRWLHIFNAPVGVMLLIVSFVALIRIGLNGWLSIVNALIGVVLLLVAIAALHTISLNNFQQEIPLL